MKKFLLSLSLLTFFGISFAKTVTFNFVNETYGLERLSGSTNTYIESGTSISNDGVTVTFKKTKTTGMRLWSDGLRFFKNSGAQFTVSATNGEKVTYVTFTTTGEFYLDGDSNQKSINFWEGNADEVTFNFNSSATKVLTTLQVDIDDTEEGAVAVPSITLGENNMVQLSQADGAEIYYTTDGTAPTNASTKYTAPFQITTVTTVKAIAYLDGKASEVSTKELKPNVVNSIADFIALENTAAVKINTPLTVLYHNKTNLYLSDNKGGYILAYNVAGFGDDVAYTNGDVLSYIEGTFKNYNSLPELIVTGWGEVTSGSEVEPMEYSLDELSVNMVNEYVKLTNVSIADAAEESDNKNYIATDADGNTVNIYNTFYNEKYYDVFTVTTGEHLDVVGFVTVFKETLQVTPVLITENTQFAAIGNIDVDSDVNAPVEYFNIQGVRVAADNLSTGIYVRRQGNTVNKVLINK